MSFVCAKHERYVPDGEECPYCEPEAAGLLGVDGTPFSFWRSTPPSPMKAGELQRMMNEAWAKMVNAPDPADSAWAEIAQKERDVVSPENAVLKLLREKP